MQQLKIAGKTIPKPALYASVAMAAGILGYAYWTKRGVGEELPDTGAVDPDIDPATGIPYADEFGSGITGAGIYDPSTGGIFGNGYGTPTNNQTVTAVTTNAGWAQAAALYLVNLGYDGGLVAGALGNALTGQFMSPDQLAVFGAARAFLGEPPNGFPPLKVTRDNGQTPDPTPNPTPTPKPKPVSGKGPVSGLKSTSIYEHQVNLDWTPISGSRGYVMWDGSKRITTSVYSNYNFMGLASGSKHSFGVQPVRSDGSLGTRKNISITTKKAPAKKKK
jgi:hypothetical protein